MKHRLLSVALTTLFLLVLIGNNPRSISAQAEATSAPTMAATQAGCTAPRPAPATAESPAAATAVDTADAVVYRFGLTPWQKGQKEDDVRRLYAPMLEWLGHEVGARFVIVSAKDYKQASEFLADNTIQFASISPSPFIEAQKKTAGIRMLVTELSCNRDTNTLSDSYRGFILTLKSRSDLNSLDDLKGKNFAFVSEESTSGFVVPNALLFKAKGLDYKTYFDKVFFPGSHPLVTDAIVAGSVDAGATWDFNWGQAIRKHGDVFKALWTSPAIPNVGIAVHPSVPEALRQKIQQALLRIDPKLLEGLSPVGFTAKPDSFYDVIRQLAAIK